MQHLLSLARSRLRGIPSLRRLVARVDLTKKYGTPRPQRARMAGTMHSLHVDVGDPRGEALARGFCRGQPALKRLWRAAIDRLQPDWVIDVGANYGEFVFLPRYPSHTRVVAVEAQPSLAPYLMQSRDEHPDREAIELIWALAADAPAEAQTFYVDTAWSGRSSAMRTAKMADVMEYRVGVTSMDAELADRIQSGSALVFKVDVEGYEPLVLQGMSRLLERCERVVGLVELHRRNLDDLGVDVAAYLDRLRERYSVMALLADGTVLSLERGHHEDLLADADFSADLVLLSDPKLTELLGLAAGAA